MKFKKGDTAYTPICSYDNGRKHIYEQVKIDDCWYNEERGNTYSFIHQSGDKCNSCPEQFLLNQEEYEKMKIRMGVVRN